MEDADVRFSKAVAAQLSAERAARHMTIAELVIKSGMSKSKVLHSLNGQAPITVRDIALFASAYNMDPFEIMNRASERASDA